jgi:hypothetical protein
MGGSCGPPSPTHALPTARARPPCSGGHPGGGREKWLMAQEWSEKLVVEVPAAAEDGREKVPLRAEVVDDQSRFDASRGTARRRIVVPWQPAPTKTFAAAARRGPLGGTRSARGPARSRRSPPPAFDSGPQRVVNRAACRRRTHQTVTHSFLLDELYVRTVEFGTTACLASPRRASRHGCERRAGWPGTSHGSAAGAPARPGVALCILREARAGRTTVLGNIETEEARIWRFLGFRMSARSWQNRSG